MGGGEDGRSAKGMKRNRVSKPSVFRGVETGEDERGREVESKRRWGCLLAAREAERPRGRVACPLRGNEDVCALLTRN